MRKSIVALILEKDGSFLVEKRHGSEPLDPGCFVFPGGHVEDGESLENALMREVMEELSITPAALKLVHTAEYEFPEEKQELYWYWCDNFIGTIQNNEADELIWIKPSEVEMLTYQVGRDALNALLKIK